MKYRDVTEQGYTECSVYSFETLSILDHHSTEDGILYGAYVLCSAGLCNAHLVRPYMQCPKSKRRKGVHLQRYHIKGNSSIKVGCSTAYPPLGITLLILLLTLQVGVLSNLHIFVKLVSGFFQEVLSC